jgi:drug/metabolite transporter (DMT)-like permease
MAEHSVDETSSTARAYVLLCLMPLFFSSNILIGRAAADLVPPFSLAFWRWAIAFAILLPIGWTGIVAHRDVLRAEIRALLAMAFLGMWICGAVVYIGLQDTTATNAALIYTASPVLIILFEWLRGNQRLSGVQLVGIATALAGVLAIIFKGEVTAITSLSLNPGDLWIAFGAVSWSIYSIVSRRPAIRSLPTMSLMAVVTGLGALMLTPFAAWESVERGMPSEPRAWASILGVAFFASVLAFTAYQKGVKLVGPGRTSLFLYLNPVYAAVLAALFLGERVHGYHLAGAVLIFAGVALATRSQAASPPVTARER